MIRSLAAKLGGGSKPYRTVVIDQRGEFIPEEYGGLSVDVLGGYRKAEGIRIAIGSLSPQIVIIDELSDAGECEAVGQMGSCGVKLVATAQGGSLDEVLTNSGVEGLWNDGFFGFAAGLYGMAGEREIQMIGRENSWD